jgi:TPR repeat protein
MMKFVYCAVLALGLTQVVHADNLRFDDNFPQTIAENLAVWRAWAKLGDPQAQIKIGDWYKDGMQIGGITFAEQNYSEAVRWYKMAAVQEYNLAQLKLALMYLQGKGVPQSYVSAHMWFNIAAATDTSKYVRKEGKAPGDVARDNIERNMTSTEISQARHRAKVCMQSGYQECY